MPQIETPSIAVENFRNPQVSLDYGVSGEYATLTAALATTLNESLAAKQISPQSCWEIAEACRNAANSDEIADIVDRLPPHIADIVFTRLTDAVDPGFAAEYDMPSFRAIGNSLQLAIPDLSPHPSGIIFDDLHNVRLDVADPENSYYVEYLNSGLALLRQAVAADLLTRNEIAAALIAYKNCNDASDVLDQNSALQMRIVRGAAAE